MPKNMKIKVTVHIDNEQPYYQGEIIPDCDDWTANYLKENGIAEETSDGERIEIVTPKRSVKNG